MHAFLVTGRSKKDRMAVMDAKKNAWRVHPLDCVFVAPEGSSIGISSVRDFQKRIALSPRFSAMAIGIIEDAHTLTDAAQHALLKTLEEPPKKTRIMLETGNAMILLPTIRSRCEIVDLGFGLDHAYDIDMPTSSLQALLSLHGTKRLAFLEEAIATKDDAAVWIDEALRACYRATQLLSDTKNDTPQLHELSSRLHTLVPSLERARNEIAANCNYRLVLDVFALSTG